MKNKYFNIICIWSILLCGGCIFQLSSPKFANQSTATKGSIPTNSIHIVTEKVQSQRHIMETPVSQPSIAQQLDNISFLDILNDNGDCHLPCILGLNPGLTTRKSEEDYMSSLSSIDYIEITRMKNGSHLSITLGEKEKQSIFLIDTYFSREILEHITFTVYDTDGQSELLDGSLKNQYVPYFLLPKLLEKYGHPDKIWIAAWHPDKITKPVFDPATIVLYYAKKGFLIQYISSSTINDKSISICPSNASIEITSWDPNIELTLEEILKKISSSKYSMTNEMLDYFKEIDKATSFTIDDFYSNFTSSNSSYCIKTSQDIWP